MHFITAVWGKDYTDTYLNTVLPNHLTEGNLGCFDGKTGCLFDLYSSAEDIPQIVAHSSFLAIKKIMPIRITEIDKLGGSNENHEYNMSLMTKCHRVAMRRANEQGASFFVLPADQVYSEGSFRNAWEHALAGARVVALLGIRVHKELFEPRFRELFRKDDNTMLAPAREMVALGLQSLHPIMNTYFVDSEEHNECPSHYFWSVGKEGLIARCLSMHPLYMNPVDKTTLPVRSMDDDYILKACPSFTDFYMVTDSDEMTAFEMTTGDFKYGMSGSRKFNLYDCAVNIRSGRNRRHRVFFRRSVFIHYSDLTQEWDEAERKVKAVSRQAREMLVNIYTRRLYPDIFPQKVKVPVFDHVRRVAVFGAGSGGRETGNLTSRCGWTISHYIENDRAKQGLSFNGAPVLHPDDPATWDCDLVIVASQPGKETIFQQLRERELVYRRDFIYYRDTVRVGNCDITLTVIPPDKRQHETKSIV